MEARYFCGRRERRDLVRESPTLSGIDFLEVIDGEAPAEELRQRLLVVRFLKPIEGVGAADLALEGGVRIAPVHILWALPLTAAAAELAGLSAPEQAFFADYRAGEEDRTHYLVVRTDVTGDFSTYRLVLVDADPTVFDPRLSSVEFSFKVECPSEFDCKDEKDCPPPELGEPQIDYLAKDYGSFRRRMLDRISALAPAWRERNPADLGITLVELLAYVGDQLSYFQDAVATEAYLGTARRRVSVRRHARLVDYFLDEGRNARAWVFCDVEGPVSLPGPRAATGRSGTPLSTPFPETLPREDAGRPPERLPSAARAGAVVFETLHDAFLHPSLNELRFYTWSDRECCLPAGATAATLRRELPGGGELAEEHVDALAGSFLLFEEVLGPGTGEAADADPEHRWVVRVLEATAGEDPLDGTAVIEIVWHAEDALPFPICLSSRTADAHGAQFVDHVSVARGNLVLADHGRTAAGEDLGTVGEDPRFYRPRLAEGPLTHAAPLPAGFVPEDGESGGGEGAAVPEVPPSAAAAFLDGVDTPSAEPALALSTSVGEVWRPVRDLLASGRFAAELVAEIDDEGRAEIRFGDDRNGKRPDVGTHFEARYRVGNGLAGNVGAEAISRVFTSLSGIRAVRNPLPADGGRAPESVEEARRYAPQAFRIQQRAVTEDDYARAAERHPEVQKAAATFRFTGSWTTVFVTIDRRGGRPVDAEFEDRLREHLGFFRMAGYDLEIDGPRFVPLDLLLEVCVEPGYLRSDVHRELLRRFTDCALHEGRRGFFHPDRWTFGQPVYASPILAEASAVPGVASVTLERFRRWGRAEFPEEREKGEMAIGRLEIARLDNDPSFQENGRLEIQLGGGA